MRYYSSVKTKRDLSYTWFRVFGALAQFGETGPKYPKELGQIK